MGLDEHKYSNGWLYRFQKRKGIGGVCLHGESGEVLRELNELEVHINTCDAKTVYNMDKTGIFTGS